MIADRPGITWYLLLAIIYFFFNSIFLPEGMLYTAILTPVFLWWLYKKKAFRYLGLFFLFTIPFIPLHLYVGVNQFYYIRSYLLLFSSIVFALSFRISLNERKDLPFIFEAIILLNSALVLIALCLLPVPEVKKVFWYLKEISPGTGPVPRLKLFTYEASYYSLLLVPVALYFYLRLLLLNNKHPAVTFILVTLPLLLSFSLGVLTGLALTFICLAARYFHTFFHKKAVVNLLLAVIVILIVTNLFLLIYFPENPLFVRIANIFSEKDTSFRGRTYEAFILAWKIASQKSILFGCGPGQAKLVGIEVFKTYYGYLPPVVRIPNTLADTMATYGLAGLSIRLFLSVYLFFKTKVQSNYYCLALYIFIFIYQFTGSFMTNIVEYVIWVLAFTPIFREFDTTKVMDAVIQKCT